MGASTRNIQVDRKNRRKPTCCVTTRSHRWTRTTVNPPGLRSPRGTVAAAAGVPPTHASADSPRTADAGFDAWRLANDEPGAGIRPPGSNADSSDGVQTNIHSSCADKSADESEIRWQKMGQSSYAGLVPWEVLLPRGSPERFCKNLSGTFLRAAIRTLRRRHTHAPFQTNQASSVQPAAPRTEKGNREVDPSDKSRLEENGQSKSKYTPLK